MKIWEIQASKNDHGRTIFKFLAKILNNIPISKIEKIFRKQDLKVNGKRKIAKNYIIQEHDVITIYGISDPSVETPITKTKIDFEIIYEDINILILNKKANQVVHGADNSLDNQVLNYLNYQALDSFIPSHIGRLDKVSSGIMVYAKNYAALRQLKTEQAHFEKYYTFINDMPKQDLTVNYLITKDVKKQVMKVVEHKGAMTKTRFFFEGEQNFAQIFTGKKHQIRVSLAKLGYPIKGDVKYGGKQAKRVYLHAIKIVFHNLTDELTYLNNREFESLPNWSKEE
ncbi:pseudouridine synthase [Candidatus Mycoplasma pogonae]